MKPCKLLLRTRTVVVLTLLTNATPGGGHSGGDPRTARGCEGAGEESPGLAPDLSGMLRVLTPFPAESALPSSLCWTCTRIFLVRL